MASTKLRLVSRADKQRLPSKGHGSDAAAIHGGVGHLSPRNESPTDHINDMKI